MVEYRKSTHAVFDIKYHVVWITKYRYKVLRGRVAERARDLIRQICEAREIAIVRGSVSPDHIHMLLSVPAHLAPAKVVQYNKGRSSRRLQDEFPELRKRYWGQHLWARGYFCATVGAVDEATNREYIESQQWDEDDQGFKIVAPTEPYAGVQPGDLQAASAANRLSVVIQPTAFKRCMFSPHRFRPRQTEPRKLAQCAGYTHPS